MSREAAFSALFAAVSAAWPWGLASRRMKLWSEVPAALRPAFFQLESGPETYQWPSPAAPKRTFEAKLFLYFDARDPTAPSATALNAALDAIDAALTPTGADAALGRQNSRRRGARLQDCRHTGPRPRRPRRRRAGGGQRAPGRAVTELDDRHRGVEQAMGGSRCARSRMTWRSTESSMCSSSERDRRRYCALR